MPVGSYRQDAREAMAEKRASRRVRTVVTGRIVFNQGRSGVDCIVRDMSAGGARLRMVRPTVVPNAFDLVIPLKETSYPASVRWRAGNEIGVALGAAHGDAETVDLDLVERLV